MLQNHHQWTWYEYKNNRSRLEKQNIKVILIDMIGQPIEDSLQATEQTFFGNIYPLGTYFVLYCHTGCNLSKTSADKLAQALPDYHFVELVNGREMYELIMSNI